MISPRRSGCARVNQPRVSSLVRLMAGPLDQLDSLESLSDSGLSDSWLEVASDALSPVESYGVALLPWEGVGWGIPEKVLKKSPGGRGCGCGCVGVSPVGRG